MLPLAEVTVPADVIARAEALLSADSGAAAAKKDEKSSSTTEANGTLAEFLSELGALAGSAETLSDLAGRVALGANRPLLELTVRCYKDTIALLTEADSARASASHIGTMVLVLLKPLGALLPQFDSHTRAIFGWWLPQWLELLVLQHLADCAVPPAHAAPARDAVASMLPIFERHSVVALFLLSGAYVSAHIVECLRLPNAAAVGADSMADVRRIDAMAADAMARADRTLERSQIFADAVLDPLPDAEPVALPRDNSSGDGDDWQRGGGGKQQQQPATVAATLLLQHTYRQRPPTIESLVQPVTAAPSSWEDVASSIHHRAPAVMPALFSLLKLVEPDVRRQLLNIDDAALRSLTSTHLMMTRGLRSLFPRSPRAAAALMQPTNSGCSAQPLIDALGRTESAAMNLLACWPPASRMHPQLCAADRAHVLRHMYILSFCFSALITNDENPPFSVPDAFDVFADFADFAHHTIVALLHAALASRPIDAGPAHIINTLVVQLRYTLATFVQLMYLEFSSNNLLQQW
jgi:hypothetical protein